MSVLSFYDQWPQYNRRLTEVVSAMTPDQLALKPHETRWPIWATHGQTFSGGASMVIPRVYVHFGDGTRSSPASESVVSLPIVP